MIRGNWVATDRNCLFQSDGGVFVFFSLLSHDQDSLALYVLLQCFFF